MGIFSFLSKNKSERVLIVNIGSASVVGAFVTVDAAVSHIRATVNTDIAVLSDPSLAQFEGEMQKALTKTLDDLSKLRLGSPDQIRVYFAAPWYASQVRIVKMSRPTPFVISKSLMNDLVAKELKAFEDEEISGGRGGAEPLRAIESKTIQVKLNGYPTSEPLGLSARELEFSLFLSVAPERTIKKIEDVIGHTYHRPIKFSSFLLASFVVSRDFFPHQEDYLLLDIGAEVTDVSLVKDSALVASLSFPRGRNFILRKLAEGLGRSIPEALSICTLYQEGKVEESVKNTCTTILGEAKDQWLDSFQKALFAISNELSIPDTVLVSVGADMAPWFVETIRREKFNQYALTEKEFKVILLDTETFHESFNFAEGVPRNSFIMVEVLAARK